MQERGDFFDGGSVVVGKISPDEAVYVHIHGSKYGSITKVKLTASEARGLARLLDDVCTRDGTTVMGLKSAPSSGFLSQSQSV